MRAVNSGNTYTIYDNSMQLLTALPAQTYLVNFDMNKGFYLTKYADIEVSEKMYGVHNTKLKKVMGAFDAFDRNLGVILSGDKGIGKSSFAKLLAIECIKSNIPVIVVNTYIGGIAEYLASFDQTVMVLFDEFDKTFVKSSSRNDNDAQTEMLTLFDGLAQGKKMFVVTCNSLTNLNDYLVNRPGRFHYHFRFDYPNADDIREYLQDKLDEKYYDEISNVITFSRRMNLNYDCLRAIAFELNSGIIFKEAILDLNIVKLGYNTAHYKCKLYFENGEVWETRTILDMFNTKEETIWFSDTHYGAADCYGISILPYALDYDSSAMSFVKNEIEAVDIKIDDSEYYGPDVEARLVQVKAMKPIKVEIIKDEVGSCIHYCL